jgi:hypothetical protein
VPISRTPTALQRGVPATDTSAVIGGLVALIAGALVTATGVFLWRDDFGLASAFQSFSSGWPPFGSFYDGLNEKRYRRLMGASALIFGPLVIAIGVASLAISI